MKSSNRPDSCAEAEERPENARLESDELLYCRYLEHRENEDLKILLERHRERLTLFLFGIVRNMEDAEELMLDAFAEAAVRTRWRSEGASFKTWLYGVGRNLACAFLRRNRRTAELYEEAAEGPGPDEDLLRKERDRQLYEAMSILPDDCRQALHLLYFEEMSVEQAAKVMKKNKKQIYNLTARGKSALKNELERRGFSDAQFR